MRDPPAGRQCPYLAGIRRSLGIKLEAVELMHEWELGDFAGHGDALLVKRGNLVLDEEGQRLAQGHFRAGGFVQ